MEQFQAVRKKTKVKYNKIPLKELVFDKEDNFFERGQYGDVKRAKWNKIEVAVKFFVSADRKGGFSEELVNLSMLQGHESIVKMHGACVSDHPFIVLEFAPLSLEKVIHECKKLYRYTSDHVISWSHQAAVGLDYIHDKSILHRDIKPSNMLLFDKGRVLKLCDFGTAKKIEHTLTNAVGTIRYMAPEVIRGKYYTDRCDVFSFGIMVWEMLARRRPTLPGTNKGNNMAILYAMANGARPPKFMNLPKAVSEMIDRCWDEEPHKRPTMSEIKQKLDYLCQFVESKKPLIITRRQQVEATQTSKKPSEAPVSPHPDTLVSKPKVEVKPAAGKALGSKEEEKCPVPPSREESLLDMSTLRIDDSPVNYPTSTFPRRTLPSHNLLRQQISSPLGNCPYPSSSGDVTTVEQVATPLKQDPTLPSHHLAPLNPSHQSPVRQPLEQPPLPPPHQPPLSPSHQLPLPPPHQPLSHQSPPHQLHPSPNRTPMNSDPSFPPRQNSEVINKELFFRSRFTRATEGSPYFIQGLDAELQAILPNDVNPESLNLYHQFKENASQVVEATRQQEQLKEEIFNLDREIGEDRRSLEAKEAVQREYLEKCSEKERLMKQLERLQRIHEELKKNVVS